MDLIKAAEAGKILGVDRTTVWRWTEDGRLKAAVKAGQESFYERAYIEGFAQERANRRQKPRNPKGPQRSYKYLFVSPRGIRKEAEIYQLDPDDPEDMAQAVQIIESFEKAGSEGYAKWVSREEAHTEVSHNYATAMSIEASGLPLSEIPIGAWGIDDIADYAAGRKAAQATNSYTTSDTTSEAGAEPGKAGRSLAPPMYLLVNPGRFRSEVNVYRVNPNDSEQLYEASKLARSYAGGGGIKRGYASWTTEKDAEAQIRANREEARENKPVGSIQIIDFGEHLAKQKRGHTSPLEPLEDKD